jgi:hypothetical protein
MKNVRISALFVLIHVVIIAADCVEFVVEVRCQKGLMPCMGQAPGAFSTKGIPLCCIFDMGG